MWALLCTHTKNCTRFVRQVENCTDLQLPDIEYNKNHLNAIDAKLIKLIKVNHNCIFLMFFSNKTICEKSPTSLTHIIKPCVQSENDFHLQVEKRSYF